LPKDKVESDKQWSTQRCTRNKNKDRQYNGQKKKHKMTSNDLHNTTQETRIRIDNTMAKRKSTKWQAMIYTTLHKKQE
jgi:hypothetical protein